MNQTLTTAEIEAIATPIPLPAPAMTKRMKLLRLAMIVRRGRRGRLLNLLSSGFLVNGYVIFHGLEHMTDAGLAACYHPATAFDAAGDDPVLKTAGLKKDVNGTYVSALEVKRFFELAQSELHEFSCDCGGVITNDDMASRIERIAARSPA